MNKESTSYKIGKESIQDLTTMDLSRFYNWVKTIKRELDKNQLKISSQILKELEKEPDLF